MAKPIHVGLKLPVEMNAQLDYVAEVLGTSKSDIIRQSINHKMETLLKYAADTKARQEQLRKLTAAA